MACVFCRDHNGAAVGAESQYLGACTVAQPPCMAKRINVVSKKLLGLSATSCSRPRPCSSKERTNGPVAGYKGRMNDLRANAQAFLCMDFSGNHAPQKRAAYTICRRRRRNRIIFNGVAFRSSCLPFTYVMHLPYRLWFCQHRS